VGERLEDQHGVQPPERRTADIVADIDAAKAERPGLADHIGGEVLCLVPVERIGRDAIRREGLGHLLDGALFLVEFELASARIDCSVHGVLPVVSGLLACRFWLCAPLNLDQ